jgi:hypothetical protein
MDSEEVCRSDFLDLGSKALSADLRAMLAPPKKTREGFLIVEGFAAKGDHVQTYRRADGSEWKELRRSDDVFHEDSLATYVGKPVTNDHPNKHLTPTDAKLHTRGAILERTPLPAHKLVKVQAIVYDAQAIRDMDNGKVQLSLGYVTALDRTPGEYNGQRFDATQRAIQVNHLALTHMSRTGPELSLRLDSNDNEQWDEDVEFVTIMVNGQAVRVEKGSEQHVQDLIARADSADGQEALDAMTAERDAAVARADAAEDQLADLEETQTEAALEGLRAKIADKYPRADTADKDLRELCEEAVRCAFPSLPGAPVEDRSDDAVSVLFELAMDKEDPKRNDDDDDLGAGRLGGLGGRKPKSRNDGVKSLDEINAAIAGKTYTQGRRPGDKQ